MSTKPVPECTFKLNFQSTASVISHHSSSLWCLFAISLPSAANKAGPLLLAAESGGQTGSLKVQFICQTHLKNYSGPSDGPAGPVDALPHHWLLAYRWRGAGKGKLSSAATRSSIYPICAEASSFRNNWVKFIETQAQATFNILTWGLSDRLNKMHYLKKAACVGT